MTDPCTEKDNIQQTQVSIAKIEQILEALHDTIHNDLLSNQKQILGTLFGKDEKGGLISLVQGNRQSILRAWWFLGFIAVSILGGAIYIIRNGMS